MGQNIHRQRQDHARRPSSDTAIEGFDQRARRSLRSQPEDGDEVEKASLCPRCRDGTEGTAFDGVERRGGSPQPLHSGSTRYCRWMTASTRSKPLSRI